MALLSASIRSSEAYRNLPSSARLLFCSLASYADRRGRSCWPSQRRLAEDIGRSVVSVWRLTRSLRAAGLIRVRRINHQRNQYAVATEAPFTDERCLPSPMKGAFDLRMAHKPNADRPLRSGPTRPPIHRPNQHMLSMRLRECGEDDGRTVTIARLANDLMNRGVQNRLAWNLAGSASAATIRHAIECVGGTNSPGLLVYRIRQAIAQQRAGIAASGASWTGDQAVADARR